MVLVRIGLMVTLLSACSRPLPLARAPTEDASDQRYFREVMMAVKQRFTVSQLEEPQRSRVRAQALVRIGAAGELLEVTLSQASGNDLFDAAALEAVKKSSPFPVPPVQLRDELKKKGVAIVFVP